MNHNPFHLTKLAKLFDWGQEQKKLNQLPDALQQQKLIADDLAKKLKLADLVKSQAVEKVMTATEIHMQQEKERAERKQRAIDREYRANRVRLLKAISDMLKEFEPYQLLLQSENYTKLEELLRKIEEAGENGSAIEEAYLDALRYGMSTTIARNQP